MAAGAAIIVVMTLFSQAISAPQTTKTTEKNLSPIQSPINLSYQELTYIVKVRSGIKDATPPIQLTPCARAILGCCHDNVMNASCSESFKCGAFFFDVNPCDEKFIVDALNAARGFYEQFNNNRVGNV